LVGKWLLRALLVLAVLVPVVVVGFFVGMRYVGPTPAQRAAIARMAQPTPPVQGHDASDAAWLLDHDVPVERWPEVAAAQRRQAEALAHGRRGQADPLREFPRYPEPPADAPCTRSAQGCLDFVAEHRAEVAALLDAHKAGIEAARALAAYDGFRLGVPNAPSLQLPRVNARRPLVLAGMAYRFAAGERLSAVESVCRDLAGWRRIGGNSDHLVVSMLGVHNVRGDLVLLADMLAKMPKETELPDECGAALEASADYEFDLCPAIRFEHALVPEVRRAAERAGDAEAVPGDPPAWLIDWRNFEAMAAEAYAPYCAPATVAALRADRRAAPPRPPDCPRWRHLADPYGCTLAQLARPSYGKFLDRRADQAQMLALLRVVAWLRTAAAAPAEVPAVLAARPKELGLLREPSYDAEHDRISIPLHEQSQGARFEVDAGAQPRPTRVRHRTGSRRSRGVAAVD
jgi:hypothetical protein